MTGLASALASDATAAERSQEAGQGNPNIAGERAGDGTTGRADQTAHHSGARGAPLVDVLVRALEHLVEIGDAIEPFAMGLVGKQVLLGVVAEPAAPIGAETLQAELPVRAFWPSSCSPRPAT